MLLRLTLIALFLSTLHASAQAPTPPPKPVGTPPPSEEDIAKSPAKVLFGGKAHPAPMQARSIGFYAHGCLAGGIALPINGKTWQVMRLSRNRNWGHPDLIAFLERFSNKL